MKGIFNYILYTNLCSSKMGAGKLPDIFNMLLCHPIAVISCHLVNLIFLDTEPSLFYNDS